MGPLMALSERISVDTQEPKREAGHKPDRDAKRDVKPLQDGSSNDSNRQATDEATQQSSAGDLPPAQPSLATKNNKQRHAKQ